MRPAEGLAVLCAVALVGASNAAPAAAAGDSPAPRAVVSAVPSAATPNVRDGLVDAIAVVGGTVVIGGTFSSVAPPGGSSGTPAHHVAAFAAGSGQLVGGFSPTLNGQVETLAAGPAAGTVYVGGDFTTVDGATMRLALLDTSTGALVAGWRPPALNGSVDDVVLAGGRLFVGGDFSKAGSATARGLTVLDPSSGALTSYRTPDFTGHHNDHGQSGQAAGQVGVKALDVNPAGTELVAVGNFTDVGGSSRDQVVQLSLTSTAAVVDPGWATDAFTATCNPAAFDSYVRDVQYSPDGSYFVVVTTGGSRTPNVDGTTGLCDSASRFDTAAAGADVQPRWVDYTGRDTLHSVAVTPAAVYVGGHQRWQNNTAGRDNARKGAVPRPGIAALDPAAGGDTLPPETVGRLPGQVCLLPVTAGPARCVQWDGHSPPTSPTSVAGASWSHVRGATDVDGNVYYGTSDGRLHERTLDSAGVGGAVTLDPYDDPYWSTRRTGSGGVYRGRPSGFADDLPSVTSMIVQDGRLFYTMKRRAAMFWRWFTPDSGVVGSDRFRTTDRLDWSRVAGAFLSGSTLYFDDTTRRALMAVPFGTDGATGIPAVADRSIDWASRGAFVTVPPGARPGAPGAPTATPDEGAATVSFAAPASDGGHPIRFFTTTALDLTHPSSGGQTANSLGSPVTVPGLRSGDSYAFTVTASNLTGPGAASAASRAVTVG